VNKTGENDEIGRVEEEKLSCCYRREGGGGGEIGAAITDGYKAIHGKSSNEFIALIDHQPSTCQAEAWAS